MSKYIDLNEATDLFKGIDATMTGGWVADTLEDLPTIEVSEDGEDYLRGYNDGWYAHEVITNAKLHIDKPRGFTLRTEKGYGNYSEDCISRSALRKEMEMYGAEITLIDAVPSVVPTTEQSSKVGEWIDTGSGQECSVCGEIQYGYDSMRKFCANCGAKMKGE